ncbi:MAG: methyl-accepting chemotaxis protein [Bradyrhizobium sp.]|nr:methyl-accepting chemotaxis protein [Bradyrhizobium sp.]
MFFVKGNSMASKLRSLRVQAGAAAAMAFASGVLSAGALSYAAMTRTLDQGHRDVLTAATNDGLAALSAVSDRMKVYADVVGRHPDIVSAVQKHDIRELEAVTVREFNAIHGVDPALATLEVTDSNGVVIQRGHNPAKRGDDKSAQPQVRTALSGKPAGGLTVSSTTGEAAEDSVRPIMFDGNVIGTLKAGSYFNDASAEELKARTGLEVVFVSHAKVIASTFGKGIAIALPPEAIQTASKGSPTTVDFAVGDTPSQTRIVHLPSDVGEGMTLAFVSSLKEVEAEKRGFAWSIALKGLLALLVVLPLSFFGAHLATRQLLRLADAMRQLATGRLDVVLPGIDRQDEIGDIAKAVENFKVVAVEKAKAEQDEKRLADEQARAERKLTMQRLADEFETTLGGIIDAVSSNSAMLENAARTLTATAQNTQRLTATVAASSEDASTNVQSVAASAAELTSSVQDIAAKVGESHRISGEAVTRAEKADARIADLTEAAARIGDVVKLISSVAEQTNLLALNATIEAARAGEAGRGFAVVAQEVKALAAQTAKATEEIGAQISGMQGATADSVEAIKDVSATIGQISTIAIDISKAVEAQGEMTREIVHNVGQAANGTAGVASNITDVNVGAVETGSASSQVLQAAQSLSVESNHLKSAVGNFLSTVRAA